MKQTACMPSCPARHPSYRYFCCSFGHRALLTTTTINERARHHGLSSGFFFGFLLGLVQMFVWLLYDKPWTLPAGGAIVGYITNWVALKLIFEPVDPVKIGPFVLQGLFLKRQNEV